MRTRVPVKFGTAAAKNGLRTTCPRGNSLRERVEKDQSFALIIDQEARDVQRKKCVSK
jgi:hypothetical protein